MWRTLLLLLALLGPVAIDLSGQTQTPRTAQAATEAQEAAKQSRLDAAEQARNAGRKRHWENQDRATRKRMRRSCRESRRIALGRTTPWWLRVLRGAR